MHFNSQYSSEKRVKHDPKGTDLLTRLYETYKAGNDIGPICTEIIESLQSSNEKKDVLKKSLASKRTPESRLKMVQDLLLAGQGFGV